MTNQITKAYDDQFKKWQAPGMSKLLGPKPTAEQLLTYHRLGARHGKQCFAGAMALREHGVTGTEITIACGAPQLNKMRGFIVDALVKRVAVGKRDGSEIYKLVLTPKGEKRIATAVAREQAAEAAGAVTEPVKAKKATKVAKKAKATSKPRKPRAVPNGDHLLTAASATATVNEPGFDGDGNKLPLANGLSGDQPADTATNL
jgi:hypothetical protein